jgi:hypothetical protein
MSRRDAELTDAQWEQIAPLWPEPQPSSRGPQTQAQSPLVRRYVVDVAHRGTVEG